MEFYEGTPVNVKIPPSVDLEVVETEPGLKGATVSNVTKPLNYFQQKGETFRIGNTELNVPRAVFLY